MTWEEKLREMREEMKWVATQCIQSDDIPCGRDALTAADAISKMINSLHEHNLNDAEWNRPAPTVEAPHEP